MSDIASANFDLLVEYQLMDWRRIEKISICKYAFLNKYSSDPLSYTTIQEHLQLQDFAEYAGYALNFKNKISNLSIT
jgi:hypothetical protein